MTSGQVHVWIVRVKATGCRCLFGHHLTFFNVIVIAEFNQLELMMRQWRSDLKTFVETETVSVMTLLLEPVIAQPLVETHCHARSRQIDV